MFPACADFYECSVHLIFRLTGIKNVILKLDPAADKSMVFKWRVENLDALLVAGINCRAYPIIDCCKDTMHEIF